MNLRQRAARALGRPVRPDEKLERTVADLVDALEPLREREAALAELVGLLDQAAEFAIGTRAEHPDPFRIASLRAKTSTTPSPSVR